MASRRLLEDGTSLRLLEDGASARLLEADPTDRGGGVLKDPARILRWYQGDDLPVAAAPSARDDTFFDVAQQAVGAFVRAGAAAIACMAAGAAFAYANDDIVPQPAPPPALDDGSGWQCPVPAPVKPVVYLPADNPEPSWRIDEVYTWAPQWPVSTTVAPFVFTATDEVVSAQAPGQPDEDYWQAPPVQPRPLVFQAFTADDERPQQVATTPLDDGYGPLLRAPAVAPVVTLWQVHDERPTPATFTPVEDDWQPTLTPIASACGIIWATDEEIVPQASGGGGSIAHETVRVVRWHQGDELPQQAATVPLDDGYGPLLRAPAVAPVVTLWQVGDERPTPAAALAAEDDAWQVTPPAASAPCLLHLPDADDVPAGRLYGVLEDYYWPTPPAPLVAPVVTVWQVGDEITQPPTVLVGEDDAWSVVTPPYPAPKFLHLPDAEEIPAGRLYGVLEDYYWPHPVPAPVPARATLWQVGDDIAPPPLRVDEIYWHTLRKYEPEPLVRVWVYQDEIHTGVIPDVYTVDSRERLGERRDRIGAPRVGHGTDALPSRDGSERPRAPRLGGASVVPDRRIGGPNARVGSGRLGWKKT